LAFSASEFARAERASLKVLGAIYRWSRCQLHEKAAGEIPQRQFTGFVSQGEKSKTPPQDLPAYSCA
jgi:hypothetical protein